MAEKLTTQTIEVRSRLIVFAVLLFGSILAIAIYAATWQDRSEYREQILTELQSYRMLVAQIPGPVCQIDAKSGRIMSCNEAFQQLCRLDEAELVGNNIVHLLPKEYVQQHVSFFGDGWQEHWDTYNKLTTTIKGAKIIQPDGTMVEFTLLISPVNYGPNKKRWLCFVNPLTIYITEKE